MPDLADRLASLSPAKRALLLELLRAGDEEEGKVGGRPEPQPRGAGLTYPLSFAQRRLWFLAQLEPGSPFYGVPTILRLGGRLDVTALQRGLQAIVERHEALRTTFRSTDDGPVQVIAPPPSLSLETIDLREFPPAEREKEALRLVAEVARRPFDLERGPMLRADLFKLDEEDYVLLLGLHHIVADGWSAGILSREILSLYDGFAHGRTTSLPPLPVQYVDFAVWQRRWLEGKVLEDQLAFWKEALGGELPVMRLPTDYPRPAAADYRGQAQTLFLPRPLAAELGSLARREGATLFMVLLAAFAILLGRLTGQEDMVIGSPIANRNQAEVEGVVGFFINTLALRVDLSGQPSYSELLRRVRDMALGAFAHQDLPFEKLVEVLQPERDLNRTPMFSVLFNVINTPPRTMEVPGLRIERLEEAEPEARFDLTFYAEEQGDELRLRLLYQKALFSSRRAACLMDQFERLLEQAVTAPERSIASYSLVTPASRPVLPDPAQPLPASPYPTAPDLFREAANRAPGAIALTWQGRSSTYAELGRSSVELARVLRGRGLAGEVVAVSGHRCPGLVTALLAVLEGGAVLLTLDRRLPEERQRLMLREGRARGLLYVGPWRPEDEWLRREDPGLDVETVDEEAGGAGLTPGAAKPAAAKLAASSAGDAPVALPADPAYIFFTSGTTGAPRGVLGSHKGLGHFLSWQDQAFGVGPGDRAAQLTGLSFDVVLRDILLPLASGATLCLPPDGQELDPYGLVEWLNREGVTLLHTVPTLAQAWLANLPPGVSAPSVRYAFFAGEPLTAELVSRFRDVFPGAEVVNLYGPTETTLAKCFYRVPQDPPAGVQPLGRPLPETQALVLTPNGLLSGIGEPGEIVIRTPFRSLGYVNEGEGAGCFRPNPFTGAAEDLVYHTGDLGRYGLDGSLEILGRLDDQVKIRGVRVEPGEIAASLTQHPAVKAAVVVTRPDESGHLSLLAYVVAPSLGRDGTAEIRSYLRRRLPAALVPSTFVFLEALPLTCNGKVDRVALPPPDPAEVGAEEGSYVAPRTPLQALLAGIWAEALGLERVGLDDNFFGLGGDSILSVRVVARVNQAGLGLAPRHIFEHQTVAELAALLESATAQDWRRGGLQARPDAQGVPEMRPDGVEDIYPLSPMQAGMFFQTLYAPDSGVYVEQLSLVLRGDLDPEVFEAAWRKVMARHATLRTSVMWEDLAEPLQIVHRKVEGSFQRWDWRGLDPSERSRRLSEHLERDRRQGFDLREAPLLRLLLIRLGSDTHRFVWSHHHLILDGWCNALLVREVLFFYEAIRAGREAVLPESRPFRDYVAWLRGQDLSRAEAFWRVDLAGLTSPTGGVAQPDLTGLPERYAEHEGRLGADLTGSLRSLARTCRVTFNTVLQGAWALLLARYSGDDEVMFGVTVSGRPADLPGADSMIGCFINTLPLRVRVEPGARVGEWLRQVQARQATIGQYDYSSLVDIQGWSEIPRGQPLFETILVFQGHLAGQVQGGPGGGLAVEDVHFVEQANYPLIVNAEPGPELVLRLLYDCRRLDQGAITRLLGHLRTLLSGMVAAPDGFLVDLPLLTEEERATILESWGDAGPAEPEAAAPEIAGPVAAHGLVSHRPGLCLHHLVEDQARRTPGAIAAMSDAGRLTYAELDARANQLAHHLRELGVGPDVPVGVLVERSLELVVGLLGILKAGGAYLPLDPDLPAARVHQLLEDARSPVCLCQATLSAKVLPGATTGGGAATGRGAVTGVSLDGDWPAIANRPRTPPQVDLRPGDLISVFYTSGSTGLPKGVCNTHGGWLNRLLWMQRETPLGPGDVTLQKTTLSFDDSAVEFFWPLMAGAGVAFLAPGDHKDPRAILDASARFQVTNLHFVPSMLARVLDTLTPRDRVWLGRLRYVISSGEALRSELVRRFAEIVGCALHNQWGATEVSIDSTRHTCTPEDGREGAVVPVGRPFAGNQAHILDRHLRPVPVGVAGEVFLAGVGLARGYLGDPAKTAEAFLPNPFRAGERMYRTGDRGYWREDGVIMFLGRRDDQVKVRGNRVELAEIEATLAEHATVKDCGVVARKGDDGYRLIAYYVVKAPAEMALAAPGEGATGAPVETPAEAPVSPETLRDFLGERLPDFMVPGRFVRLESLPVTASGKLDRKLLPDPGDDRPDLLQGYVAPATPVEVAISAIWQDVLGLSRVGVHDRFFDLGGHSLDATRVMSRLSRELEVSLPLRALFEAPTVAELAERVLEAQAADSAGRLAPIPRLAPRPAYEMSHAQKRFWFQYQFDPKNALGFVFTPVIEGPLDREAFMAAYRAIVARHGVFRTVFSEKDGQPLQIVREDLEVACDFADLSGLPEESQTDELARRVAAEAQTPFDLTRESSFRVTLHKLGELRYVLMISVHAIAFDGWSTEVLMRDLTAFYRAYRADRGEPDLPPPLQYVDYAAWHNRRLASGELDPQRDYWRGRLAGASPPPDLPPDVAGPPPVSEPMVPRVIQIEAGLTGRLRELATTQGTTLYMTLLAGLDMWLARATGQTDVVVCSPLSGRNHPDLEEVLGLMVNPVALRTDLSGNPTGLEVLARVRQTALEAHGSQDYPFDLVVQDLRRGGRQGPLYSIVFVVQNANDHFLDLDGVTFKGYSIYHQFGARHVMVDEFGDDPTVRLDLHIEVYEIGAELSLLVKYDSRRFRADTIDRFMDQFRIVLGQFAANPGLRLSQVNLPSEEALGDLFGEDGGRHG